MSVLGLDVSHYQGIINWQLVPDEYKFVFIRTGIGDGSGYDQVDHCFAQNWEGAKGRLRGAYHVFRSDANPTMQMNLIKNIVPQDDKGELPLVTDVERKDGGTTTDYRSNLGECLSYMDEWYGRPSIIYTGVDQWSSYVIPWLWKPPTWQEGHPLWISDPAMYRNKDGVIVDNSDLKLSPRIAKGWDDWTFWQKSWVGRIPGISGDVDINEFNGTLDELMAYATPPAELTLEQRVVRLEAWVKRYDPTFLA